MRRALLKTGVISAILFIIIYLFGAQLAPLLGRFGAPDMQNTMLYYLLLVTVTCVGLYILKPLIGIVILALLVLVLFMLFHTHIIYVINVVV